MAKKEGGQKTEQEESSKTSEEGEGAKKIEERIISKTSILIMSGLGYVTALAWNGAIQSTFREFFGSQDGLWVKYVYAVLLTVFVALVTIWLDRMTSSISKEQKKTKEKNE